MYLIDESIKALQEYSAQEMQLERLEKWSSAGMSGAADSAWQDYEKCQPVMPSVMQYGIKTPAQLMQALKEMWKGSSELSEEEFIKLFAASAFRQTIEEADAVKAAQAENDVSIPSFIYNF